MRDRLGQKPLYHGVFPTPEGPIVLFGSELGALRRHPAFDGELDRDALASYLRFNYLLAPRTIRYRRFLKASSSAQAHSTSRAV